MSLEARLAAWIGAALLILSVLASVSGFEEVQFSSNSFEQIGTLVLTLILVALVIGRAVEVYVAKRYDPEKLRLRRPLARAEIKLAKAEKALAEERERRQGSTREPTQEDRDYMGELVRDVHDAHELVDAADDANWLLAVDREQLRDESQSGHPPIRGRGTIHGMTVFHWCCPSGCRGRGTTNVLILNIQFFNKLSA